MKVLYFHQHFSTPQGAAGIRSYEMAQALLRAGHSVTMVCGSYGAGQTGLEQPFAKGRRRGTVDGIDVIEFDLAYSNTDSFIKRTGTFLKFALRSLGLALSEEYDLLFATTTPLTAGIPGIVARPIRRKPFVFEVRDLWPELPKAMGVISNPLLLKAMSILEWMSYHSADRCIGLAPGISEGIARRGIAWERIETIPNGCDIDLLAGGDAPWRPRGVSDRDLMAVFTGTHGKANGLAAVLAAAAELKARKRDDIKLVLAGVGAEKEALVARAATERLDNVIFHAPVPKAKLSGLLRAADLGLQILANVPAFYYGTSPNKFFDYIAVGLPVLINYPGWLAEKVTGENCGFTVPPDDPTAFADALCRAADDRQALRLMAGNAFALARKEFNRAVLAQRFVGALERIAPEKGSKSTVTTPTGDE